MAERVHSLGGRLTDSEIAQALHLSTGTVKNYSTQILSKQTIVMRSRCCSLTGTTVFAALKLHLGQ